MTTEDKYYVISLENWIKGQELLIENIEIQEQNLKYEISLKQRQFKHCKEELTHELNVLANVKQSFNKCKNQTK